MVLSPSEAVGHCGIPVNIGLYKGAYVDNVDEITNVPVSVGNVITPPLVICEIVGLVNVLLVNV